MFTIISSIILSTNHLSIKNAKSQYSGVWTESLDSLFCQKTKQTQHKYVNIQLIWL